MAKVVLDVPDEFMSLVGAWQTILDNMKATVDRTGGGKAVDYAQIERNAYDQCREGESDIHHVSLQAVDIHVPMVAYYGDTLPFTLILSYLASFLGEARRPRFPGLNGRPRRFSSFASA